MGIAYTVKKFLQTRGKVDLLEDDEGCRVAVLPATHHVRPGKLPGQTLRSRSRKSDRGQKIAVFLP